MHQEIIQQMILKKTKIIIFCENNEFLIKKDHEYYAQIQAVLNILDIEFCDLII